MAKKSATSGAKRSTTGKNTSAKRRSTSKRDLIETGKNKVFAKRNAKGEFKEMDDVGRSLSADRRTKAKAASKSGHGDQGDRKRAAKKR